MEKGIGKPDVRNRFCGVQDNRDEIDIDSLLRAFIEGNDDPAYVHQTKTDKMLKGIHEGLAFSGVSFYLGPIYWAYRKCYVPACVLGLISFSLFWFLHFIGIVISEMIASSTFFLVYRKRARNVLAKAKESGCDQEEMISIIKRKGGTFFFAGISMYVVGLCVLLLISWMLVDHGVLPWWYGKGLLDVLFD